jgi:hypothetical protein
MRRKRRIAVVQFAAKFIQRRNTVTYSGPSSSTVVTTALISAIGVLWMTIVHTKWCLDDS